MRSSRVVQKELIEGEGPDSIEEKVIAFAKKLSEIEPIYAHYGEGMGSLHFVCSAKEAEKIISELTEKFFKDFIFFLKLVNDSLNHEMAPSTECRAHSIPGKLLGFKFCWIPGGMEKDFQEMGKTALQRLANFTPRALAVLNVIDHKLSSYIGKNGVAGKVNEPKNTHEQDHSHRVIHASKRKRYQG